MKMKMKMKMKMREFGVISEEWKGRGRNPTARVDGRHSA